MKSTIGIILGAFVLIMSFLLVLSPSAESKWKIMKMYRGNYTVPRFTDTSGGRYYEAEIKDMECAGTFRWSNKRFQIMVALKSAEISGDPVLDPFCFTTYNFNNHGFKEFYIYPASVGNNNYWMTYEIHTDKWLGKKGKKLSSDQIKEVKRLKLMAEEAVRKFRKDIYIVPR
ncbi:MAG: hypothetical protein UV40_C0014G0011 [Parcubacteria group bacterium GW2011_GWA1_42_7]|nr:MAG: hypothetical protein UV34_C0008G0007 [Parcubacteria group bacterium GW2011_GWB1_42_6]KKS69801.1 MAG: hypothetical protein UV40_C0014G0011 [Parcubacteria group bacterium GW2011_GWA1_42_7]KKS91785.1 MAG: hypothetical protein UV67_C0018G0003 [Parcubacteria group bacterium GW2011_GWC1_43_12]